MSGEKRSTKTQIHTCCACGEIIEREEEQEYIRTRRHTDLWLHKSCFKQQKKMQNEP